MRGKKIKKKLEMTGIVAIALLCVVGSFFFYGKNSLFAQYLNCIGDRVGFVVVFTHSPGLQGVEKSEGRSLVENIEQRILRQFPLYTYCLEQKVSVSYGESKLLEDMLYVDEVTETGEENQLGEDKVASKDNEEESGKQEDSEDEQKANLSGKNETDTNEEKGKKKEEGTLWEGNLREDEEEMYPISSIKDYQIALDTFYQVDSTTMLGKDLLKVEEFLKMDMTIQKDAEGPQILIYHTHSQEGYKGDKKTVVDLGDELTKILEDTYGISVLHHKGKYDVESRDYAYSEALPEIRKILKENPSIEVVIDLHRDGVAEETHLVTTIDGKKVAKMMFFNGVSRTKKNGEIPYLENPFLKENLAFSFQMQLAAKTYFPTLTRDIYIKGYRYNMHLMAKSLLVEVGAQTNTYEEAKNAMPYLAELLYRVLTVKR